MNLLFLFSVTGARLWARLLWQSAHCRGDARRTRFPFYRDMVLSDQCSRLVTHTHTHTRRHTTHTLYIFSRAD
uniref:Secreted protein n=1 Tax=Anguilla anguilla TaxID=7936 RepID=A0A0E9W830_ANGAN